MEKIMFHFKIEIFRAVTSESPYVVIHAFTLHMCTYHSHTEPVLLLTSSCVTAEPRRRSSSKSKAGSAPDILGLNMRVFPLGTFRVS